MRSKGTQTMQKIVIKKPWGVEIKDYKAGDPIPAGVKFKIFDAKDTAKIEAYADSLDESATYQKKRFKEPAYMYESVSASKIRSAEDLHEWMLEYMRKHGSNRFTSLQFILSNGNNIIIAWDMKSYKGIHEGSKDYTMTEFVYKFMDPIIKQSGISDIYEADMNTGRFKAVKESKKVTESFLIMDTINGKPTYFHYGKYTGYDWWDDKSKATKFMTKDSAERMIEKMRQEGALIKDMKVVEEGKITESVIKAYYRGNEHRLNKEGYVADKDGKKLAPWKTQAYNFGSDEDAAKAIKVIEKKPEWKDFTLVVEGRIARGYENLDANEKAKHLLSHPCSKYMGDLKTGNITERAIRKAVKEMLGKPDKDDPQFIIDVNEGCDKVEESFLIVGKLPYDDLKQAYISYSDKGFDLHTPEYKKHATRFSSRQEAQKVLDQMKKEGWHTEKFDIVQEEGEASAAAPATSTANVANPELPLKLKESLSSKNHKFKPEELKVGKRVIDKVGGREVHGKITVNHHDLYKDNPYTQDKKGSTVVTIVTDSGRSYDVDANDNGGEFILEGCKGKKKVVEGYTVIFPTGSSEKLKTIADVNKFVNGVLKMMGKKAANVQLTDATLDKWNKENDIPLVIVKEDTEDSYKYQTSVAGGVSSDPETCENAKEHEEATSLIESIIKKTVKKKLTESVGQKLNITLIRKPYNMKEVEDDIRKGHGDRVKAIVDKSYKLSANEYDKFVYNFMVHTTYLSGEGGVDPDGTVHVVEITAPGKKTIYVDPEGYDYARYVGW